MPSVSAAAMLTKVTASGWAKVTGSAQARVEWSPEKMGGNCHRVIDCQLLQANHSQEAAAV
jgi:hypothetical protein